MKICTHRICIVIDRIQSTIWYSTPLAINDIGSNYFTYILTNTDYIITR